MLLGALACATDCDHIRQGEAIFIEVDNELCLGNGEIDSRCIFTLKVVGVVCILNEFIEEPEMVVVELIGDPASVNKNE